MSVVLFDDVNEPSQIFPHPLKRDCIYITGWGLVLMQIIKVDEPEVSHFAVIFLVLCQMKLFCLSKY